AGLEQDVAILGRYPPAQQQACAEGLAISRQRDAATTPEIARYGSLGRHLHRTGWIGQRREPARQVGTIGADLDAECTLPRRRQAIRRSDDLPDTLRQAEPLEPGGSEQDRVELAGIELREARIDVATQRLHPQAGMQGPD